MINCVVSKNQIRYCWSFISNALNDSYISHDGYVTVNNLLREHGEMKEETKNAENAVEYTM